MNGQYQLTDKAAQAAQAGAAHATTAWEAAQAYEQEHKVGQRVSAAAQAG